MEEFVRRDITWNKPLPPCDICKEPAPYDAPTKFGPWANLCDKHMKEMGIEPPAFRRVP